MQYCIAVLELQAILGERFRMPQLRTYGLEALQQPELMHKSHTGRIENKTGADIGDHGVSALEYNEIDSSEME